MKLQKKKVPKKSNEIVIDAIEQTKGEMMLEDFVKKDMINQNIARRAKQDKRAEEMAFEKDAIQEARAYVDNVSNRLTATTFKEFDDQDQQ